MGPTYQPFLIFWSWSSPIWPASPNDPPVFASPVLEWEVCTMKLGFCMGAENQTWGLRLAEQALYQLSCCPSPRIHFLNKLLVVLIHKKNLRDFRFKSWYYTKYSTCWKPRRAKALSEALMKEQKEPSSISDQGQTWQGPIRGSKEGPQRSYGFCSWELGFPQETGVISPKATMLHPWHI